MQNTLEARECIQNVLVSLNIKKNLSPDEVLEKVQKGFFMSLEGGVSATPRMSYINSNLKSVYYVIHCDRCEARCRKSYLKVININGSKVIKFLCSRCANVKYARKTASEKRALHFLLNPEKLEKVNPNSLSLKGSMAILEAMFMQDELKKKAIANVSKYRGN